MENKFLKAIGNISQTENGAFGYKSTFDPMVDFGFRVASYRSQPKEKVAEDFEKILESEDADALKFLFYIRDVRGGLGERNTFRVCLKEFVKNGHIKEKRKLIVPICDYIMEYGRADDMFCLLDEDVDPKVQNAVYEYIAKVLSKDLSAIGEHENLSLLAKWMPSENASSKKTKELAVKMRKNLGYTSKQYRKILSALRREIAIVERYMSSNNWGKIDYNKVPSLANLNYRNVFLKHDHDRRVKYLQNLADNAKGVKMNMSVAFPYEIVHKYMEKLYYRGWDDEAKAKTLDQTLELAWKNLKDVPGLDNCLVVADDSGSMSSYVSGDSKITAMDVARSIAIYGAQHLSGPYNGKIITFSEYPQYLDISKKKSLKDILEYLECHSEVANTNIEAVFDLILKVAVSNKLEQKDLPKSLIIISDMEFDECVRDGDDDRLSAYNNPIEAVQERFEKAGYKIPTVVFWNVCSRTMTIPVTQNELGVLLISGFSQNLFEGISLGELDTRKMLEKILNSDRYSKIKKVEYKKSKKH